jgi:N-acetylglucosaminyl-diphospho-decaprenol L-rhamnosyltransferase
MSSLAIVIVAWNTRDLLVRCIASIHASLTPTDIPYQIVVVDNGSADGTAAMLRAGHPEVVLLEAGRNLGFAGGNNFALRRILGRVQGRAQPSPEPIPFEYVFLLNPDTEVQADAIARLVRYLDEHSNVALVGPQLRYADGSVQPSRRRLPGRGVFFWESTPLEWRWPGNPWARHYRIAERSDDEEQVVEWLVGAALLVRRAAIERAGLLDARFALYSEELEWQRRITASGAGRIVFLPAAVVVHHEGKSSEQVPARRLIVFHQSRLRYAGMTYGPRFAAAVYWFLLIVYTAELASEALKWAIGHRRALRAARIDVYRRFLAALVRSPRSP